MTKFQEQEVPGDKSEGYSSYVPDAVLQGTHKSSQLY